MSAAPQPAEAPAHDERPSFLELMAKRFVVSVEIDPPRGVNTAKVLDAARMMAERGVDAINIADSPLARIRMSNLALGYLIHSQFPRLELILHVTTRDRNLMGLQSDLLGAHALGLRNILCLTGDPPFSVITGATVSPMVMVTSAVEAVHGGFEMVQRSTQVPSPPPVCVKVEPLP